MGWTNRPSTSRLGKRSGKCAETLDGAADCLSASRNGRTAGEDYLMVSARKDERNRIPGFAMIQTKRVYDPPAASDGLRILIDRLWPRGLTKKKAAVDGWMKELAPSTELRRWFAHDPEKWREFQRRYREELKDKSDLVRDITDRAASSKVTLVYGARDVQHNDAAVLANVVRERLARRVARAAAALSRPQRGRKEP
jgi:uncharacterized protein YeaO (DUF488 family)